jgi:hypothetical protein
MRENRIEPRSFDQVFIDGLWIPYSDGCAYRGRVWYSRSTGKYGWIIFSGLMGACNTEEEAKKKVYEAVILDGLYGNNNGYNQTKQEARKINIKIPRILIPILIGLSIPVLIQLPFYLYGMPLDEKGREYAIEIGLFVMLSGLFFQWLDHEKA